VAVSLRDATLTSADIEHHVRGRNPWAAINVGGMARRRPSTMAEDYLQVIWKAEEWSAGSVTTKEIAATLGVAASSVSGNLKKLARDGLIDYVPYGRIGLSDAGRAAAVAVVRRHRLIETYLVRRLGFGWDEVHGEAGLLEHAVSDRVLDRIDEVLGRPGRDPHGDPIPRPDGPVEEPGARRVSDAEPGGCGTVVRISDREPALLRYLDERGFRVGTRLRVRSMFEAAGSVSVSVSASADDPGGAALELPMAAADAMWISAEPGDGAPGPA
jgi:DtxR family Mn-dependent transcriptional regulator